MSCNQPKSLSGIETNVMMAAAGTSPVAINLNPYQGLKQAKFSTKEQCDARCNQPKSLSGIETTPALGLECHSLVCCNQPKSLSGIETWRPGLRWEKLGLRCNQPKSLSGIETISNPQQMLGCLGCNQPKSLSGIETRLEICVARRSPYRRCNQPKSLSGIETHFHLCPDNWYKPVAINLNPYQGLKLHQSPVF